MLTESETWLFFFIATDFSDLYISPRNSLLSILAKNIDALLQSIY